MDQRQVKDVKILPSVRFMMKAIGMQVDEIETDFTVIRVFLPYLLRFVNLGILAGLFIAQMAYVYRYYGTELVDKDSVTDIAMYCGSIVIIYIKYYFLMKNQHIIKYLVHTLNRYTNERKSLPDRATIFEQIDKTLNRISKTFIIVMLILPTSLLFLPPIIQISNWLMDPNSFVYEMNLPTVMELWYDYKWTPMYEITFMLSIPIFIIGYFHQFFTNIMILSITFYMVGATKDFCLTIRELDNEKLLMDMKEETENGSLRNRRIAKMISCIHYHRILLHWWDLCQEVFQGPMFIQGASNSLLICLIIYKMTTEEFQYKNVNLPVYAVITISELFGITSSGQRLYDQMKNIPNELYNLKWYQWDKDFKYLFKMMLMRSWNIKYFSGYKFFTCNLETFKTVMSTVASIYAMLRSLT